MHPRRFWLVSASVLALVVTPAEGAGQLRPSPGPTPLPPIAPVDGRLAITVILNA
jgi:hypothetical protein